MYLTDDEKAMLNGDEGVTRQKAMELLFRYAEALGAERFVNISSAGGTFLSNRSSYCGAAFEEHFASHCLDYDEALPLADVKISSMQFETCMDPDYYDLHGKNKDDLDFYLDCEKKVASMGIELLCTCTPYQVGNIPMKGEHCAWMESSAVVFINGALGARTNCEGAASGASAMFTGKTPYWGLHIPDNRYATHYVRVDTDISTFEDWGLLGYYIGKMVPDKIPVIDGIKSNPSKDMLKQFGATAASSGGLEMYHIAGITPEAPTLKDALGNKRPIEELVFGAKEKKEIYELMNVTGRDRNVDFVMLGCPHYSLEQVAAVCSMLNNRKVREGVNLWIFVPKAIKTVATQNGFTKKIEDAGGYLMANSCPCLGRFRPQSARIMATDAGKHGHYMPNFYQDMQVWYGSTSECIEAAVTGKWEGRFK